MADYDVVVVGAGLGGLACASRLSRLGHSVGVIDKHAVVGGYASHFTREGFRFDVSLHGIGSLNEGSEFRAILEACGVMHRIKPISKAYPYSVYTDRQVQDIPQDAIAYQNLLCELYPSEVMGIRKLFGALERFKMELSFLYADDIPEWKKGLLFPIKCPLLLKWSRRTTEQVCKEYVSSVDLISFFTVQWPYYGLPPHRLSALYFFIPWVGYHMDGCYYLQGGGQSLSDGFADSIRESGGSITLKKAVKQILHEGRRVRGVELKDGSFISADWVVSNASPSVTMRDLIKVEGISIKVDQYVAKLGQMEVGTSILQLFLGLDCSPENIGFDRQDLHVWENRDHLQDYRLIQSGDYAHTNLLFTNYSMLDGANTPGGKGIMVITCLDEISNWPDRGIAYKQKKKDITDLLLNRAERFFPGIRQHVVVAELATPRTMERYTGNSKGAVYGYAQTVKQSGIGRLGSVTPFQNLSLVGAWTRPGGGYQGAIISGFLEANRIHRKIQARN